MKRPELKKVKGLRNIKYNIDCESEDDGYVDVPNDSQSDYSEEGCDEIPLSDSLIKLAVSLQQNEDAVEGVIITAEDELEQELQMKMKSNLSAEPLITGAAPGSGEQSVRSWNNSSAAECKSDSLKFDSAENSDDLKVEISNVEQSTDAPVIPRIEAQYSEQPEVKKIIDSEIIRQILESEPAKTEPTEQLPHWQSDDKSQTLARHQGDGIRDPPVGVDESQKAEQQGIIFFTPVLLIIFALAILASYIIPSTGPIGPSGGVPSKAKGKTFRLVQTAPSLFTLEQCEGPICGSLCANVSGVSGLVRRDLGPVPFVEPSPLLLQARGAVIAMGKDISCQNGPTFLPCLRDYFNSTTAKIQIVSANTPDALVLKWNVQAELADVPIEVTSGGSFPSLLPSFGFYSNDNIEQEVSITSRRWLSLPKLFRCLKNDVIVPSKALKKLEEEHLKSCTSIRPVTNLAVVGKAKAGKSTIINALVGRTVMPVNSDVCTATIIQLSYPADGQNEGFEVLYKSADVLENYLSELKEEGSRFKADCDTATTDWYKSLITTATKEEICFLYNNHTSKVASIKKSIDSISAIRDRKEYVGDLNAVFRYADGTDDNHLPLLVEKIHLFVKADILKFVSLIDTPGMGDNNAARNNASQRVLTSVDGFIYIVSAQEMKTLDVRRELDWIRVIAGDIPHIKLLSRVNEFTSWRLDPIKAKGARKSDIESALLERRKEYNAIDEGGKNHPIPWNNALAVMQVNQLMEIESNKSPLDFSYNAILDALKGNAGVGHLQNILGSDDNNMDGFRDSAVASSLGMLINSMGEANSRKGDDPEQQRVRFHKSWEVLKWVVLDSSGLVQSMLAVKKFISDVRLEKIVEKCQLAFDVALNTKIEEIAMKIKHHNDLLSEIVKNQTWENQIASSNVSAASVPQSISEGSPEDVRRAAKSVEDNLIFTRDRLVEWRNYFLFFNITEIVSEVILSTFKEKWRDLAVDTNLKKSLEKQLKDEFAKKDYSSVEFTYCGYLRCSAFMDLHKLYDIPLVQKFVTLFQAEVGAQLFQLEDLIKNNATELQIHRLFDYPSVQASRLKLRGIGELTGTVLGMQATSIAAATWEHESLYYRWECNEHQCKNSSMNDILLDATGKKLKDTSKAYKETFRQKVTSLFEASLSKDIAEFQQEIDLQIRNIEDRIRKWGESKFGGFADELKALEDDHEHLSTAKARDQRDPTAHLLYDFAQQSCPMVVCSRDGSNKCASN